MSLLTDKLLKRQPQLQSSCDLCNSTARSIEEAFHPISQVQTNALTNIFLQSCPFGFHGHYKQAVCLTVRMPDLSAQTLPVASGAALNSNVTVMRPLMK